MERTSSSCLRAPAITLLVIGLTASSAIADEPLWERLRADTQRDYLTLGVLLQVVGDAQGKRDFGGENGFSVANARVSARGRVDGGFSYFFQANLVKSPALLDGRLTWTASPAARFDVGQFKAPFSQELLTSAADIDFVNRSQVVTILAPGRQIGLQLRGTNATGRFGYGVGVFNGSGIAVNGNDGGGLMASARLDGGFGPEDRPLDVGLNAAFSDDKSANLGTTIGGAPLITGFRGTRAIGGADARWTPSRYLVAAEFIYAQIDPDEADPLDVHGLHVTAGMHVSERSQLLVRFDQIRTDTLEQDSDLLLAGWNLWPTSVTAIQVNLVFPTTDYEVERTQVLANVQFGF